MDRGPLGPASVPRGRDRRAVLPPLVAALGQPGFLAEFARACEALYGADQVTSFFLGPRQVRCVLAHRPAAPRLVEGLCRDYARAWHRRDALPAALPGEDFAARRVLAEEIGDEAYRARLFGAAGLGGKIAVLSRHAGSTLYWNLYFRRPSAACLARAEAELDETGPLLAQALHKHDALSGAALREGRALPRLEALLGDLCPALSPRERAVAARIAAGEEVAQIAAALAVGAQTVMTFRKRAYAKLGVSSRAGLAARCMAPFL